MLRLTKELTIKCERCGCHMHIGQNDFEYTTNTYEKSMGAQIEYEFRHEFQCRKCHNEIYAAVWGYEYPVGAFDSLYYECEGGEILKPPVLEVEYEPDEDDDSEEYSDKEYLHKLVRMCDTDYVMHKSKYVCKDGTHTGNCSGDCGKCLNQVHFSCAGHKRKDYDCNQLLNYYVGKYMYAYVSEDKRAFEIIERGIRRLKHIHMLSLGCGPSPDLFGIMEFLNERKLTKSISYIGYDNNPRWKPIHESIRKMMEGEAIVKYRRRDAFQTFAKKTLRKTNIFIMQYFLSHVVYSGRMNAIEDFFDNLVEHVIMEMEPRAFIVINDINHCLARDWFAVLERKIKDAGKKIRVHKYYFEYDSDMNEHQTGGMIQHATNEIDYDVDKVFRKRYKTRLDCRSVQHIIEVTDL